MAARYFVPAERINKVYVIIRSLGEFIDIEYELTPEGCSDRRLEIGWMADDTT